MIVVDCNASAQFLFALPESHFASDARVSMDGIMISKDWQDKDTK